MSTLLLVFFSGFAYATPLVLAGVGGSLSAKVNVFNIALEGMMLVGAFSAFAGATGSDNPWVGLLFGAAGGLVVALVFAVLCVDLGADPIVAGIALNIACQGATDVLLTVIYHQQGSYLPTHIGVFAPIAQQGVLSQVDLIVVLAALATVATGLLMYRTTFGLRVRAVGLYPHAAATVGVSVRSYRYLAILIGGVLCGIAGAYLPLNGLGMFSDDMTAGAGFIALAAVIFADGNPWITAAVAFVFGLADAVGSQLQLLNIPNELVLSIPYLLTIAVLVLQKWRLRLRERQSAPAPAVLSA